VLRRIFPPAAAIPAERGGTLTRKYAKSVGVEVTGGDRTAGQRRTRPCAEAVDHDADAPARRHLRDLRRLRAHLPQQRRQQDRDVAGPDVLAELALGLRPVDEAVEDLQDLVAQPADLRVVLQDPQ